MLANFPSFRSQDKAKDEFLALGQCNWVVTKEIPPIFNGDVTTEIGNKAKIKFITLLVRSNSMSFKQFTTHHKEKHIGLFSSVLIIKNNVRRYVVSHNLDEEKYHVDYKKAVIAINSTIDNFVQDNIKALVVFEIDSSSIQIASGVT